MNIVDRLYSSFKLFPENVAISEKNSEITYAFLYDQCAKVANYLVQRHVVNAFIAIEVDGATDHIIAMLGILMSGNAYISITAENKVFLSEVDALQIRLTITSGSPLAIDTVCIRDLLNEESAGNLNEEIVRGDKITPKAPMCAFFTSGSTGKAKVIIHTHQNIFTDTMRQIRSNEITASDKIDLIFSLSFSASLACIFPALFTGAELAVFNLQNEGLHQLAAFWQQRSITFTTLSVSSFQGVCKIQPSFKHLHALRFISIGAEPVKDTTIHFFQSKFPATTILQIAYASTETRTISEIKIYNDGRPEFFADSVGKPVEEKSVFITDPDGNRLPANEVGEIAVVSAYIADGYWNQSEESKRSFVKTGRLVCYRTGDLGYLNHEGYLFYAGRNSYEYKLNGIKINSTAIEQAVEEVEGILSSAVVICQANNGQQKLTCFFTVSNNGFNFNKIKKLEEKLRECVSATLPPSHQPQFYIQLDELPFTHSGKIDRKTLEKIDPVAHYNKTINSIGKHDVKEDSSEAIPVIVETFKNILGTSEIDENSNFFYNGGDSLSCLVCIAKLEAALNVKLKAFVFVSNPTPKQLSEYITANRLGFSSFIERKALNGYSKERKNLYLLHHLQDNIYDPLIHGKLSEYFNLVMCYYDLRHVYESDNAAHLILQELIEMIKNDEGAMVLGYSVSGYLGHQLASALPKLTCVMIDTYNYFEIERYQLHKGVQAKLKNFFWQIVQNKDYAYPWFLLRSKYVWIFIQKKQSMWVDDKFFNGVNYLIEHLKNKTALHNCIYFEASRHHQDYGRSWKSYVRGHFYYKRFKCTHHNIIKNHAAEISNYIIKKSTSGSNE